MRSVARKVKPGDYHLEGRSPTLQKFCETLVGRRKNPGTVKA